MYVANIQCYTNFTEHSNRCQILYRVVMYVVSNVIQTCYTKLFQWVSNVIQTCYTEFSNACPMLYRVAMRLACKTPPPTVCKPILVPLCRFHPCFLPFTRGQLPPPPTPPRCQYLPVDTSSMELRTYQCRPRSHIHPPRLRCATSRVIPTPRTPGTLQSKQPSQHPYTQQ